MYSLLPLSQISLSSSLILHDSAFSFSNVEIVNKLCKLLCPVKEACLFAEELVSVDSTLKLSLGHYMLEH